MKAFHTPLILLLILSTLANAETPPELFRVSKVGADKSELLKVFEQVQLVEGRKGIEPQDFKVNQRLNETQFSVYKVVWDSITHRGYAVNTEHFQKTDRSKLYWLITQSPENYVDDEKIKGIYVVETDEVKTYTNLLGAQVSARILREAPQKEIPREEFIKRLQAGETWTIPSYKSEECHKCYGDGKLSKMQGEGKCPDCNATGTSEVSLIVRWK